MSTKKYDIKNSAILKKRHLANRLKNFPKNYTYEQKCYAIDDIPEAAREAKKYVKALADPDILELNNIKRWNVCSKLVDKATEKKDLEQILFHVKNGLTDVNSVKLKDNKVYDGVEVKYENYFRWNVSTNFETKERNNLMSEM